MRPSEQIGQVEEDSHEYASREGHEQPLSPSPSLSGSYEYDDDDDQEEQEHDVKGDAPLAELPIAGPSTTAPNIPAPPPQKPKRTRQLTTPHQAAVLHALLAQESKMKARLSFVNKPMHIVTLSYDGYARGCGPANRFECS